MPKNQIRMVAVLARDHITTAFNDGTILQGFAKSLTSCQIKYVIWCDGIIIEL